MVHGALGTDCHSTGCDTRTNPIHIREAGLKTCVLRMCVEGGDVDYANWSFQSQHVLPRAGETVMNYPG